MFLQVLDIAVILVYKSREDTKIMALPDFLSFEVLFRGGSLLALLIDATA